MSRKAIDAHWPAFAIAGMVALTIGLGLVVTGGPGQGRKERRDEMRLEDLNLMSAQVHCLARAAAGQLPTDLAPTALCPGALRRADPFSGQPYRYDILSPETFRLCAEFETDLAVLMDWNRVNLDAEAGCILYHYVEESALGAEAMPFSR